MYDQINAIRKPAPLVDYPITEAQFLALQTVIARWQCKPDWIDLELGWGDDSALMLQIGESCMVIGIEPDGYAHS